MGSPLSGKVVAGEVWRAGVATYNTKMRVHMVCPAPAGSKKGNRVTAERWAGLLRRLGHHVAIAGDWDGEPCDVLVALHARKSHPAVRRFRRARPHGPVVVTLTGTDLYHDLATSARARRSLELADRIVVLHHLAGRDVPAAVRRKVRVVIQSAEPVPHPPRPAEGFRFCVLGHLRAVKDPLRAARALARIDDHPEFRVVQAGGALSAALGRQARRAMARDPRYTWLGELSRARALKVLAASRALVVSSRLEGGANVVSEAVVNGVPVLASRIPGNLGLLGADYPATFAVGDTAGLAELMRRIGGDAGFYRELERRTRALAPDFTPQRERESWRALLAELTA
jgi:putative glycosyltransferase (TIGR04348 family)